MHLFLRAGFGSICLSSVLLTVSPSLAQTVPLKANLSSQSEVPPANSKATGTFTGSFDPSTKTLTYTINYSGLSGEPTAAHFHGPAQAGENAGVALPIGAPMSNPIKGSVTLTEAQARELMDGKWYVNVHTAANKAGELRGQVEKGGM